MKAIIQENGHNLLKFTMNLDKIHILSRYFHSAFLSSANGASTGPTCQLVYVPCAVCRVRSFFSRLYLSKRPSTFCLIHFGGNSGTFKLQFFANILIFIVLFDSTKKTLGYRRSCEVNFENFEFFIFLGAQEKFQIFKSDPT